MLIEFSVKNFLSFKDKVTLSMEKGNGDENLENIIIKNHFKKIRIKVSNQRCSLKLLIA